MTSTLRCGAVGRFWPYRTGAMQDPASELRRIPLPRTPVNKGLARSSLRQVARLPLNESQQPRASFICVGETSTLCSLLAKCQKSDDNHRQQYRGPIQNLGPQVVIVAKQFEVRLRDQQHRIDRDSEDHQIREDVQAFEVDQAVRAQVSA